MAKKSDKGGAGKAPKPHPNVEGLHHDLRQEPITHTLKQNFMPYAMSVIVSRAIPEIDGFKPSQRKLLYTMYKMGLLTGARTKSANVVGQTMRLNPHGDGAIYETMVRLTRGNESLLHPFVDSKGNFGKVYSRDMAYAASRYTEVKLEGICKEIFDEIDRETVDFMDNYDNTTKEPTLLPTKFPNVLTAPNLGIAVGMASRVCSFNLAEVCRTAATYLQNPDCDLTQTLPAPDFSTGGELLMDEAVLRTIYDTGRGSLRLRAKWRYNQKEGIIEVYEIPYGVTIESVLDTVRKLVKDGKLKEISDMRNESDLQGLKLAIDVKRGTDPDKLMPKLFRSTPLCDTFSCNFNILIAGSPQVMGVRQILEEWCAWRRECVRRRVYFDATKLRERLHLLYALQKVLLDIDKAIRIIRETEEEGEVVPNLMIGFGVDETQANYIADIRLRNINRQYILRRIEEVAALEGELRDLEDILSNPKRVDTLIIKDLQDIEKKYARPRRTEIIYNHEEPAALEEAEDYPVHVFISREGYCKKITPLSLRQSGEHKYKEGDGAWLSYESANRDELLLFTSRQQCYKAKLSEFDDGKTSILGDYLPSKLGFEEGETLVFACTAGDFSAHLLFLFENGKLARVESSAYATVTNRRKLQNAFSDKSPLAGAMVLAGDKELAVFSSDGRLAVFHSALIQPKSTRSTQGVGALTPKKNHRAVRLCAAEECGVGNLSRYRLRSLPGAGALVRAEDKGEVQLTLD